MPPSPTAIAILEFGKLLHDEERRYKKDRDGARIQEAEQKLIGSILKERSPSLRTVLNFNKCGKNIEPLTLRTLAYVAYVSLCSSRLGIATTDIIRAIAGEEPAAVLEARQTISRLLIRRQLWLKNGHTIEPSRSLLDYLGGGTEAPPLIMTDWDLQKRWHKAETTAKRKAKVPMLSLPTAKQLVERIAKDVIGLDSQIRTLSCRLALHLRRAALIRSGKDPKSPNEALLFIGPSGAGKTYLTETAGRVCGLPFGAISATDLTSEGYVGLNVDDALKSVIVAADHDLEKARHGICFFDEWSTKRTSGCDQAVRDIGGAAVQQAVLKLVEGFVVQVGGRKGSLDWSPTPIDTRGMFFAFAGSFDGLDEILGEHGGHGIGFGALQNGSNEQPYLVDALVEYGMIPPFCNRLTGIIMIPPPTIEQLVSIATRSVIPSFNALLSACKAEIQVDENAVRLMAECSLDSRSFARGIKSIVSMLVEDLVYNEVQGVVSLGAAEVRRAVEHVGLRTVAG